MDAPFAFPSLFLEIYNRPSQTSTVVLGELTCGAWITSVFFCSVLVAFNSGGDGAGEVS